MKNENEHILIVEDEKSAAKVLSLQLKDQGYQATFFHNADDALMFFKENHIDLVLLDYKLPGMPSEVFFEQVKTINPLVPVLFMTAYQSVEKAVELLKMGAFTYLTKPLRIEELFHNIHNALEKTALIKENQRLQETLRQSYSFDHYVFNAPNMQPVMDLVMRAADSQSNILITGESGTGKDIIANIIHLHSKRRKKKLVKVNLAALPETLIEAELFGALKGAYTGAVEGRTGRFEEAHGGTLFIDEIGELSPGVQVKLLRVVQEREISRLGSNKMIPVDIRLITATNKSLDRLVQEKKFREDLFYRLNVIHVHLPPLRERKEDIPYLVDTFIRKYNRREDRRVESVSREALDLLMRYPFPGNIRELENIIERSLVLTKTEQLTTVDLPVFLKTAAPVESARFTGTPGIPLPGQLQEIESQIIRAALKDHGNNQTRAAHELGISEARLRYRLKALGLTNRD